MASRPAPPPAAMVLLPILLLGALGAPPAGADETVPFALTTVRVPGRPVEALALPEGGPRPRLVVASIQGQPPEERRTLSVFPPFAADGGPSGPPWRVEVGPEVVAFDAVAPSAGASLQLVLLEAERLRVLAPGEPERELGFGRTLPLPPRTRDLSRLALVRRWEGEGLAALVPTLEGVLLVPLSGASPRALALPVLNDVETLDERRPVHEGYAAARLLWPSLALADDDGDGRADLFAFTRFELLVFRAGPDGLPSAATRRERMPAFTPEQERRYLSNALRAFARDVDGDGRADLVVHRTEGTLLRSHATTTVHLNRGGGASPTSPADAVLEAQGGFGAVALEDLDGDGRAEVIQTFVPFGVLQLVRALATRRVEATLRVHAIGEDGAPRLTWEESLGYSLDFSAGRVVGLLPSADGDWDGDGLRDLLVGDGATALRIRLGRRDAKGFGFSGPSARQEVPPAEYAAAGDLDGDGLDDLVLYDPFEEGGQVHVGINRGRLAAARTPTPGDPADPKPPEPARADASP